MMLVKTQKQKELEKLFLANLTCFRLTFCFESELLSYFFEGGRIYNLRLWAHYRKQFSWL